MPDDENNKKATNASKHDQDKNVAADGLQTNLPPDDLEDEEADLINKSKAR